MQNQERMHRMSKKQQQKQLKTKIKSLAAQTSINLKALKDTYFIGSSGANNTRYAIKAKVNTLADGSILIDIADATVDCKAIANLTNLKDWEVNLLMSNITSAHNELLSKYGKALKLANEPMMKLFPQMEQMIKSIQKDSAAELSVA